MALINCPRCGGSKRDRLTGKPCEFCGGTGEVEVNDKELESLEQEKCGGDSTGAG